MALFTNPYLRILDEITPSLNYIPSKEEYVTWYKKHQTTIKDQPNSDFLMPELIWAFNEFKNLVSILEHEQTVIEANNRYKLLDKENEEDITEWLLEYENEYEYAEHFFCSHFEWEDDKIEGDKIVVSKELGIKIELSDFKEYINLEKAYKPLMIKYKENIAKNKY